MAKNASKQQSDKMARVSTDSYDNPIGIGAKIYNIIFWVFSIVMLIFAIDAFIQIAIIGGILFLLTAVLINPLVCKYIREELFAFPKWLAPIILIVGFVVACIAYYLLINLIILSISPAGVARRAYSMLFRPH